MRHRPLKSRLCMNQNPQGVAGMLIVLASLCLWSGALAARGYSRMAFSLPFPAGADKKVYLVTGSTDGIGKHTAKRLAGIPGATVLVHGRNPQRVQSTLDALKPLSDNVHGFVADLSSFAEVKRLAREVEDKVKDVPGGLVLINNAGVFEERRKVSADGLEMTFAVNVAAPFLLTGLLLPLLKRRSGSRIVNVSSISQGSTVRWDDLQYEKPGSYSEHSAYSLSKLLMAMFSMELAKRVGSRDLPVVSCDPGTVNTKMLLAGWGYCGIDVSAANDEFFLATDPSLQETGNGKYYVSKRETRASRMAYEEDERERLWKILEGITGASY